LLTAARSHFDFMRLFRSSHIITLVLAAALAGTGPMIRAQDTATSATGLTALVATIRADVAAGKRTPAALADDLAQFDRLLAAEGGKRTEQAAHIIMMKGMIYAEIFDDPETAKTFILQVQQNYPDTSIASKLGPLLAMLDEQAMSKRSRVTIKDGGPFPDFAETNILTGAPLSVGGYKGRVVLVDFWATWCPLCRTDMPTVVATYDKYHAQGLEVIGVCMDVDKDTMLAYTQTNHIVWPQYFDGLRWQNKLAVKYAIEELPANILISTNGTILARNVTAENLDQAVTKALGK